MSKRQWIIYLAGSLVLALLAGIRGSVGDEPPVLVLNVLVFFAVILALTSALATIPAGIYWLTQKKWEPVLTRARWVIWSICAIVIIFFVNVNEKPQPPGAQNLITLAESGPEEWLIDEQLIIIDSTYYVPFEDGLQYTITLRLHPMDETNLSAEGPEHEEIKNRVFPVIRHAYENRLYARSTITLDGEVQSVAGIGIALIQVADDGSYQGLRFNMRFDEIEHRISAKTIGETASQSE